MRAADDTQAALQRQGEEELAGISVEAPAAIAVACIIKRSSRHRYEVANALERGGVKGGLGTLASTIAEFREFAVSAGALSTSAIRQLEGLEQSLVAPRGGDEAAPGGGKCEDKRPGESAAGSDRDSESEDHGKMDWTSAWC